MSQRVLHCVEQIYYNFNFVIEKILQQLGYLKSIDHELKGP